MKSKSHLLFGLTSLFALARLTEAASPTSFCKCTCFSNSTIIPMDAHSSSTPKTSLLFLARSTENEELEEPLPENPPSSPSIVPKPIPGKEKGGSKKEEEDRVEFRAGNCNDCNRQYCKHLDLPICKGAGMEDIFATCFQRDSRKDEAVVFIFIFATAGLLIWAAAKPWVGKWLESARECTSYIPVSTQADN